MALNQNSSLNGWIINGQRADIQSALSRVMRTSSTENGRLNISIRKKSETKQNLMPWFIIAISNADDHAENTPRILMWMKKMCSLEYASSLVCKIVTNAILYVRLCSDEIDVVWPLPRVERTKRKFYELSAVLIKKTRCTIAFGVFVWRKREKNNTKWTTNNLPWYKIQVKIFLTHPLNL